MVSSGWNIGHEVDEDAVLYWAGAGARRRDSDPRGRQVAARARRAARHLRVLTCPDVPQAAAPLRVAKVGANAPDPFAVALDVDARGRV